MTTEKESSEMTMSKFAQMTLYVMRGLDPRIHEAARRRKPYVVVASPWIAGSSPAMTNVEFWRNEPEIGFGGTNLRTRFGGTNPRAVLAERTRGGAGRMNLV